MLDCSRRLSRRRLIRLMAVGALVPLALACGGEGDQQRTPDEESIGSEVDTELPGTALAGKLTARPGTQPPTGEIQTGLQTLGLERDEDAILYVPEAYRHAVPAPLVVTLHGAGGNARIGIDPLLANVGTTGALLLATSSRERTWDIITSGGFGADIWLLDRALATVFERYAIDPARIAVSGFSDGASYALSVGLTNGDLFSAIMAFSPGFVAPGDTEGEPRIFIAHGTKDIVLPIDQTSRPIVAQLEGQGYAIEYVEFDGLHSVPDEIVDSALDWWIDGRSTSD